MDEALDYRKWDELIPDALGLIFKNLSLRETLTIIPRVCKSWGRAVMGPYCWQEIDIEEWSRNSKPKTVDRMLRLLITRSCGSLRKLTVCGLAGEENILFIANHAQSLRTLRLPRSEINDPIMEKAATKLSTLTSFDLSYCINIGAPSIEAIGTHCKSLTCLRRIMHPLEVIDSKLSQDDEALAIASTMPKLKHLEIAYLLVQTSSIVEILKRCESLELLDVRGCWNVDLEGFLKGFPRLRVVGPLVVDCCYDVNGGWDKCSDYSGSSGYLAWDFVAGDNSIDGSDDDDDDGDDDYQEMLGDLWEDDEYAIDDDVEMWFYDDLNAVDAGYDWPQSP